MPPFPPPHWLHHYGNSQYYQWRLTHSTFRRPLGLVEFSFDADGRFFDGRADMNCLLTLAIKTSLSSTAFRERILIAWTCMRCQHALLRARTVPGEGGRWREFAVEVFPSVGRAIEDAGREVVFLEDYYGAVEEREFYGHCLNVGRVVRPDVALGKVFVLPVVGGVLRLQFVIAHEICDGLSSYVWMRDLVNALNQPERVLRERITEYITPGWLQKHLPLPQEALYSPIPGSRARQRWFWAITRILRHVRKPLPIGFNNPLKRPHPQKPTLPISPTYSRVLDYSKPPCLNSYPVWLEISPINTHRLRTLCKQTHATLGAGVYALSALVAMDLHQTLHPLSPTPHFITGFPLDPRSFFNFHTDPDSMMLAFSDGIALPFLPSHLPLAGRIRLLARQAQRQLASYQKRARPPGDTATTQFLTSRGAGLVLANQYLYSLERADACVPGQRSLGLNAQGAFPARQNPTMQTHGVSSVGNREALIRSGIYDLDDPSKDLTADFRELSQSVRPREGEFLVGIGGSSDRLFCTPSVDSTNLDPALVDRWRDRFENILDDISDDDKAKL